MSKVFQKLRKAWRYQGIPTNSHTKTDNTNRFFHALNMHYHAWQTTSTHPRTQHADSAIYCISPHVKLTQVQSHISCVEIKRFAVFRRALPFPYDLKLSALSTPDTHTHTYTTYINTNSLCLKHTHRNSNTSHGCNYGAEIFILACYQMHSSTLRFLC